MRIPRSKQNIITRGHRKVTAEYNQVCQEDKRGSLKTFANKLDCFNNTFLEETGNQFMSDEGALTGGGVYNYITNPLTNRKISIYGKLGKQILKNYFTFITLPTPLVLPSLNINREPGSINSG